MKELVKYLNEKKFSILCGVPDSLLSELTFAFNLINKDVVHLKSTSEGSSIGQAIGAYLSTTKPALVYMQNSGLGNCINPLSSLAAKNVYGIPILLVIGWRSEIKNGNQVNDEDQHKLQGKITLDILKLLDIEYKIIDNYKSFIDNLKIYRHKTLKLQKPVALIIRKNTFKKINNIPTKVWEQSNISRKLVLNMILSNLSEDSFYVTNTGFTSREFLETKLQTLKESQLRDFLCIGGMGHAISVSTGIAATQRNKKIVCLDGDGSMLMHLGSYRNASKLDNILVFLFNNGCHESVGGNLTDFKNLSFADLAKKIGFQNTFTIYKIHDFMHLLEKIKSITGSIFIEVRCNPLKKNNLIRPKITMQDLKNQILSYLNE